LIETYGRLLKRLKNKEDRKALGRHSDIQVQLLSAESICGFHLGFAALCNYSGVNLVKSGEAASEFLKNESCSQGAGLRAGACLLCVFGLIKGSPPAGGQHGIKTATTVIRFETVGRIPIRIAIPTELTAPEAIAASHTLTLSITRRETKKR
jgi:hypothetical protein